MGLCYQFCLGVEIDNLYELFKNLNLNEFRDEICIVFNQNILNWRFSVHEIIAFDCYRWLKALNKSLNKFIKLKAQI